MSDMQSRQAILTPRNRGFVSIRSGKTDPVQFNYLKGASKKGPFECKNVRFASSFSPLMHIGDAAYLLTVGNFLLTVELFTYS